MADNVEITAGTGTPIKTDDVAGKHYQIIKLASGETDATGTVYTDTGSKDHALRVVPASDIPTGTYLGDVRVSGVQNVTPSSVFGVTGTFWQTTQPTSIASAIGISGTVSVSPAGVFGVTGTFYQAKQPVSIPDAIGISGSFGVTPNSVFGVTGSVSLLGMVQVTGSVAPANQPVSPSAIFGVTGTFFQSNQPVTVINSVGVSGTVMVSPASAFGITGSVSILGMVQVTGSSAPANQPVSPSAIFGVTGTFFQETQPVSIASAIGISGSFSANISTPISVSGTVSVIPSAVFGVTGSISPASIFGVTGTFFQAKQPVSVPDAISISGSFGVTPNSVFGVTGTFYQATQPVSVANAIGVSGTVSVVIPTGWNRITGSVSVTPSSAFGVTGTLTVNPGSVFGVTGTLTSSPLGGASVLVTGAVTNGAYSVSDVVGGLITFPNAVSANGKTSILNSLKITGVVAIGYEVWFFSQDIATPRADNAVFGLAEADGAIFLGCVPIATADWNAAQTAFKNVTIRGIGLQMKAGASTTNIYAYIKATEVTSPGTTKIYIIADFEYLS